MDFLTVALLTPVLVVNAGEYAFPLLAIATSSNETVSVQGVDLELEENWHDNDLRYGLATPAMPAGEGRQDYIIQVRQGITEQEIPVVVIGRRPPVVAWWLLTLPLAALLLSVRFQRRVGSS